MSLFRVKCFSNSAMVRQLRSRGLSASSCAAMEDNACAVDSRRSLGASGSPRKRLDNMIGGNSMYQAGLEKILLQWYHTFTISEMWKIIILHFVFMRCGVDTLLWLHSRLLCYTLSEFLCLKLDQ